MKSTRISSLGWERESIGFKSYVSTGRVKLSHWGHYRCQIFDDLIHASRERSTIRSAERGNSADSIQQLTSRMRQRQTLAPWQRSPEGIVREIPLWRCLLPLRCQNEPLRWNYGALVLASRLLGLGLRPSVPGYLVRHATGD